MKPIKNVYIAGPMRGYKDFNFSAFDKMQAQLETLGYTVFSPAAHDRALYGDIFHSELGADADVPQFDLRKALAADMAWISEHADGVVLLDRWRDSRGAKAEHALAIALGLPVCLEYDVFENWGPCQVLVDSRAIRSHPRATAGEEMTTSATGGMKGTKLARFDLIPVAALTDVAEHYGRTADKYPPNNWRQGFEWSKSYAALLRHVTQWWGGEDTDEELQSPHLAAVAWHALTLLEFAKTHPEHDDRYSGGNAS